MRALAILAALAAPAFADDDPPPRELHGSIGVGGDLLITGSQGQRQRLEVAAEFQPRSRYGILLVWRGVSRDRSGLVLGGVTWEPAASRPRIALAFHAEAGADLDARAPAAGGGLRTTVGIIGPLGVVLDGSGTLVLGGGASRFQLAATALLAARF